MTWSIVPTPYGSVSLNGSTQYLSRAANAALNPGAGDFTLEAWVYITSYSDTNLIYSMEDSGGGGGTGSFAFGSIVTSGRLYFAAGASDYLNTTGPIVPLNTWNHIALVRSGTTYRAWLNGSSSASTVQSLDTSGGGEFKVGRGRSTSTNYFNGYISNFRMVKGVAVYTGAFTPPTGPLFGTQSAGTNISAITGTQTSVLLNTPNDANFIKDSSANNFTLINNGTATVSSLTPFDPASNTAWAVSYNPFGSVSFNGTSQYLSVANNAALNLSSGDFTIEAWIYWTGVNASSTIVDKDGVNNSTYPSYELAIGASKLNLYVGSGTGVSYVQQVTSTSVTVPTNQWVHVAAVKSGSTLTLYQNGSSVASATQTGTIIDGGKPVLIGYENGQPTSSYFSGYISNFRIVKGLVEGIVVSSNI